MRLSVFLAFLLMLGTQGAAEIALPRSCTQLACVTTRDWSAYSGTLQRWERDSSEGSWRKVGTALEVQVGERGLAWGRGLHSLGNTSEPRKMEGDRKAPAGLFALTGSFGAQPANVGKLPWQQITPTLEAVDDSQSRYYNRIVDRARVGKADWSSSEKMSAIPDYALGIVVAHNPQNIAGAGSCIFIHLLRGKRQGTAGCTILREGDLLTLMRWLDPARQPLLLQLPKPIATREAPGF